MNPIQNSLTGATSGTTRGVGGAGARAGSGNAVPSQVAGASSASSETVSISESARALNAAAADSTAVASNSHIEALRSALAAGVYTVDPKKIAQGLMRDSRALQQAGGR